ncbi:MAG: hypothetical protein RSC41_01040 [Oscillospiraceae bacterium]
MEYRVKKICCNEQLRLLPIANSLIKKYLTGYYEVNDILAVCFNMAVCFFCVVDDKEKRIFSNPQEVGKKFSLEEIAKISMQAQGGQDFSQTKDQEWGVNESFGEK